MGLLNGLGALFGKGNQRSGNLIWEHARTGTTWWVLWDHLHLY